MVNAMESIRSLTTPCIAYWIAFGPHGPRAETPPGENTKVFLYTMIGVIAAGGVFSFTRYFARGTPHTMNKEWQEATNEYMRVSMCLEFLVGIARQCSGDRMWLSANTSSTHRRTRSSQLLSLATQTTRDQAQCSHRRNQRNKFSHLSLDAETVEH